VRVWRLAPSALAAGVAGRIGGDDDVPFRQTFKTNEKNLSSSDVQRRLDFALQSTE